VARADRWARKERGGRWGHGFFALVLRSGGLALTPFFLFWTVLYFLIFSPAGRRASCEFADRVGQGGSGWRRLRFAYRHFFGLGTTLIDRLAILRGYGNFKYEYSGTPALVAAGEAGRGAVLVTGHVGSWEVMGHLLADRGWPVTLVMHDAVQPKMKETIERMAEGRAFNVLWTDGSAASAAAILDALSRGEMVGMMGDRLLAGDGARVPFLGGEVEFPVGPYALAAAAEAPVFHVFAVRTGKRRYAFHALEAGIPRYSSRKQRAADLARWAGAFATNLETYARTYPAQWGNFFSIWV